MSLREVAGLVCLILVRPGEELLGSGTTGGVQLGALESKAVA